MSLGCGYPVMLMRSHMPGAARSTRSAGSSCSEHQDSMHRVAQASRGAFTGGLSTSRHRCRRR
eukprot:778851-Prymnesium_polylepis.1